MAHRLSSGAAVTPPAALAAAKPEAEPAGGDVDMYDDEPGMDVGLDDSSEPMLAEEPAAVQQQQQPAAAAAAAQQDAERVQAPQQQQQAQQETPGGEAAAKQPAGAGGKTPWRTPAPVFNEAKTPATSGPASGWQMMYQEEGEAAEGEPGAGVWWEVAPGGGRACRPHVAHAWRVHGGGRMKQSRGGSLLLLMACSRPVVLQMRRPRQRPSGRTMAACPWTARASCEWVVRGTCDSGGACAELEFCCCSRHVARLQLPARRCYKPYYVVALHSTPSMQPLLPAGRA